MELNRAQIVTFDGTDASQGTASVYLYDEYPLQLLKYMNTDPAIGARGSVEVDNSWQLVRSMAALVSAGGVNYDDLSSHVYVVVDTDSGSAAGIEFTPTCADLTLYCSENRYSSGGSCIPCDIDKTSPPGSTGIEACIWPVVGAKYINYYYLD